MEDKVKLAEWGSKTVMVNFLLALAKSTKPIIAVVRGGCMGISYTMLAHSTFIYCSEDAKFKTPFMATAQSPEGGSTILFPQLMGQKKAHEALLLD